MKAVFLDIDNTLLSFDGYVKQTMKEGFEHFGLKPYEPYMFDVFIRENTKLWRQIEQGTLVFEELEKSDGILFSSVWILSLTVLFLKNISGAGFLTVQFLKMELMSFWNISKGNIFSVWLVMVLVSSRCTGWRLPG